MQMPDCPYKKISLLYCNRMKRQFLYTGSGEYLCYIYCCYVAEPFGSVDDMEETVDLLRQWAAIL